MLSIIRSLVVCLLLIMPTLGLVQISEDAIWTDTTDHHSDADIEVPVVVNRFRRLHLDVNALSAFLTNVTF